MADRRVIFRAFEIISWYFLSPPSFRSDGYNHNSVNWDRTTSTLTLYKIGPIIYTHQWQYNPCDSLIEMRRQIIPGLKIRNEYSQICHLCFHHSSNILCDECIVLYMHKWSEIFTPYQFARELPLSDTVQVIVGFLIHFFCCKIESG